MSIASVDDIKISKPEAPRRVDFNWSDPFLLTEQLTEDERLVSEAAKAYCK